MFQSIHYNNNCQEHTETNTEIKEHIQMDKRTITAKELKVGDRRVWKQGTSDEIIRIEPSKTGKSLKVTVKWFDRVHKEWKDDTRTLRAETKVEVEVVEPVTAEGLQEGNKEPQRGLTAYERWFTAFIEEKGLNTAQNLYCTHNGSYHIMELEQLLHIIKNSPTHEQKQIKIKLMQLDFFNGDIMHFLQFLFESYIKVNY